MVHGLPAARTSLCAELPYIFTERNDIENVHGIKFISSGPVLSFSVGVCPVVSEFSLAHSWNLLY